MHTKETVTGRQELTRNDFDVLPASGEVREFVGASDGRRAGPNVVALHSRPEGYCQWVKIDCGPKEDVIGHFLDSENLDREIANGKRTHVHVPAIGGGLLVINGEELPAAPVSSVGA